MSKKLPRAGSVGAVLVACAAATACSNGSATSGGVDAARDHRSGSDASHPPDTADSGRRSDAGHPGDAGHPSDAAHPTDAADAHASPDAAAPVDASPPPYCGDGGYLFCDGFEQGTAHWTQSLVTGGAVTTDTTHVHSGTHALHAHIDAITDAGASATAFVQQVQAWPTHVFMRVFAYQPSPFPPSPAGLLEMVHGTSPYSGIEVDVAPSTGDLTMKTYNTSQDQSWASTSGATTTGTWTCFELEVDTTAETSHLYLDGAEVTDLAQTNLALPQLGIAGVGLTFNLPSVQGAEDAWIDDVAVNGSRIGCGN